MPADLNEWDYARGCIRCARWHLELSHRGPPTSQMQRLLLASACFVEAEMWRSLAKGKRPTNMERFRRFVHVLCEARRLPGWKPEFDRDTLATLEDLYAKLTDEEQELVEAESWRAWP